MKKFRNLAGAAAIVAGSVAMAAGPGTAAEASGSCWSGSYIDGQRTWTVYCDAGERMHATCVNRINGNWFGFSPTRVASYDGQRLYSSCSGFGPYAVATDGWASGF